MDYSLDSWDFGMKYKEDYREATGKEGRAAYEKYKDFYATYHQDHPAATTDCYAEFLQTLGKQGSSGRLLDTIESKWEAAEKRVVEQAFDLPFRDPDKLEERFIKFVDSCAKQYQTDSEFYAPYTTLVQASGTGKTKLLHKAAESVKAVYCCLREQNSSGHPARSYIANKLLDKSKDANSISICGTYLAYIVACVERSQQFEGSHKSWFQTHTKSRQEEFWKEIELRMDEIKEMLFRQVEPEIWISVIKSLIGNDQHTLGTKLQMTGNIRTLKILFIFDEARYLTTTKNIKDGRSHFYYLRHALKYLPRYSGIFAIFTDTISRISNFAPKSEFDPSLRISEAGEKLFPPFYILDTIDIYAKDPQTPGEAEDPACLFRRGRPLWGSLFEAQSHNMALTSDRIIDLARDKIIGGTNFTSWKKDKNRKTFSAAETLSILGPRLCIDVSPWTLLSSQLISSHMWLCLHVSEERDRITTSLPSEPILAEAASRIINDPSVDVSELLNVLASTFREGVVLGGYRGELVARFLLLRAWDVACNKRITSTTLTVSNQYSLSMTLGDFLKTLLVAETYKELAPYLEDEKDSAYIQSTLCNALIRFTHFIKVTYTPSRQELLQFFIRGAAVLCKECEKGADIIIPIFMGKADTSLDADRISYVLIQVKNLQNDAWDDAYPSSATSALSPARIGIEDLPHMPFLSIYMQLRSQSNRFEVPSFPTLRTRREAAQLKRTIDEVGDKYLTRDDFLKKARLTPPGEPASASEISAFRNHFQVAFSLFGLSPDVYACLTPELTHALEKLLVTSMDVLDKFVDNDDKQGIIRMLPLQYR
uniref:Cytochrome c-type biogenesis protein CycH n=1 Tax=Anthurium amnicola TaxID=1678845 RepID=A0A1D1XK08_9ARAE